MKNVIKIISIVVAFVATAVLTFIFTNKKIEVKITNMTEATLPVVSFETEGGTRYNYLHGYTCDVDTNEIRDLVTAIPENMRLKLIIDKYNADVKQISYEIKSLDNNNLYENTSINNYDEHNGQISCELNIKNLIEKEKEYLLIVNIKTANFESVCYYTRITYQPGINLDSKLDFAKEFTENTLDSEKLNTIKTYIEPNSSHDNTNFGKINIHASLKQFGFDELLIEGHNSMYLSLKELDGNNATVNVAYNLNISDFKVTSTLLVEDSYVLTETPTRMYLMDFEREANQVFDPDNAIMPSSRVYLGISSEFTTEKMCNSSGKHTAFVRNNELWMYGNDTKQLKGIFTFREREGDNVREGYNKHGIKIIDIDSKGNMRFAVYGYMNRGAHEGALGISVYSYKAETNTVDEIIFIASDSGYDVISAEFGELIYVNKNGTLYMLYDDTLYSLEASGKECVKVVENLKEDSYIISPDMSVFTYLKQDNSMEVIKLEDFSKYTIDAAPGDKLALIGYLGEDWAYGMAKASDISMMPDGTMVFPMYRIVIIDKNYNLVKNYSIDGTYVSDTTISGKRLLLDRVIKREDGIYVATDDDQLMSRDENVVTEKLLDTVVSTQTRKKELYISLPVKVESLDKFEYGYSDEVAYGNSYVVNIEAKENEDFFAYGKSNFEGKYENVSDAIINAYNSYGKALDAKLNTIYVTRSKSNAYALDAFRGNKVSESDSLAEALRIVLEYNAMEVDVKSELQANNAIEIMDKNLFAKAYNIKGPTLDCVLYYVYKNTPVIAKIGVEHYVVITGYTKTNVTYFDPVSGQNKTIDRDDFEYNANKFDNTYIIYIRRDVL